MDDLQKVTPSATENKDHFVIVDAVVVTKSKKSETRSLERKPTVSMKELMMNVALGDKSKDTLTSLANRITRLDKQMTEKEHKEFKENVGLPARDIANNLLNAFDEDIIAEKAKLFIMSGVPTQKDIDTAQKELLVEATKPFYNPDNRDFIENIRRSHDQVIDTVNLDSVVFAGFDSQKEENADKVIASFKEFIEENKDEIITQ